jgi:rRNA pseudouridine-1189 N-methylase Emg1 (Nep1/Mra1 family)
MMGYQLFKDVITERIMEMLPPLFWNHEAKIQNVKKVNQEKEALIIVPKDRAGFMTASPAFYMEDLYDEFSEHQDMDEILEKIACDVVMYTGSFPCGDFRT